MANELFRAVSGLSTRVMIWAVNVDFIADRRSLKPVAAELKSPFVLGPPDFPPYNRIDQLGTMRNLSLAGDSKCYRSKLSRRAS